MTPAQRKFLLSLVNSNTAPEDQKAEARRILGIQKQKNLTRVSLEPLLVMTREEAAYMAKNKEACRELAMAYNAIKRDKLDPTNRREWNYRLSVFRQANILTSSMNLPTSENLSRPSPKR